MDVEVVSFVALWPRIAVRVRGQIDLVVVIVIATIGLDLHRLVSHRLSHRPLLGRRSRLYREQLASHPLDLFHVTDHLSDGRIIGGDEVSGREVLAEQIRDLAERDPVLVAGLPEV
ncbi:UNVERIFIED_ORG: hypothetical protein M2193_001841 [Bradyrhizobium japonicum]|uniref:hypothetical protein n=1 Tax=Bradyrhizobium TaxID=374 RepID=UPI0035D40B1E